MKTEQPISRQPVKTPKTSLAEEHIYGSAQTVPPQGLGHPKDAAAFLSFVFGQRQESSGEATQKWSRAATFPGSRGASPPKGRNVMSSMSMSPKVLLAVMVLVIGAGLLMVDQREARAGEVGGSSGYKVLEPIRQIRAITEARLLEL